MKVDHREVITGGDLGLLAVAAPDQAPTKDVEAEVRQEGARQETGAIGIGDILRTIKVSIDDSIVVLDACNLQRTSILPMLITENSRTMGDLIKPSQADRVTVTSRATKVNLGTLNLTCSPIRASKSKVQPLVVDTIQMCV